jgi:hypothetical protein
MRAWKGKASTSPPAGPAGNILFAPSKRASAVYGWPVTVSKNVQTDAARIAFGSGDYDRALRLPEGCCALLLDPRLTGFWFTLAG